jgi:DNA polymerase-3 subunit delta'
MPLRDVLGHNRLIALLKRSVAGASLPPSLLFAGPAGVGKRKTAVGLAQALNCLSPRDGDACGSCAACSRIARGVHPDVAILEPEDSGAIKIEAVRDVVDRAAYRPFEGRRRVVIIDNADALVPQAQNALLKTLEEPPPSSVFILVTARPDVLLPTVRSRCPQLRFRPLSAGDIAAALIARGADEREARAVAATANGSLGEALDAAGGDLVEAREVAHRVLARAGVERDPARRIELAKELLAKTGSGGAADREQLSSYLRAMASLLRDAEILSTGADAGVLANVDARPALERLASTYQRDRGVRAFEAVDQALVALAPPRNAGVKIVADWVVLQL